MIDHRSLYDRLQEQKQRKDLEYEEAHKLKNMIRGLDDDEVDFLELVDRSKLDVERKQREEERKMLQELKQRPSVIINTKEVLEAELMNGSNNKSKPKLLSGAVLQPSQKSLLAGMVRKRTSSATDDDEVNKKAKVDEVKGGPQCSQLKVTAVLPSAPEVAGNSLQCIGILPGIGSYKDTSDSDDSSDALSPTRYDFIGRKIVKEGGCE